MANADAPPFTLLHCVVFGAASKPFLSRLAREKGIWNFFLSGSRRAVADHSRTRAKVVQFEENEEIFILCPNDRVAEITEFCWIQLNMDRPGRGVIYTVPVDRATEVGVPEDPVGDLGDGG